MTARALSKGHIVKYRGWGSGLGRVVWTGRNKAGVLHALVRWDDSGELSVHEASLLEIQIIAVAGESRIERASPKRSAAKP